MAKISTMLTRFGILLFVWYYCCLLFAVDVFFNRLFQDTSQAVVKEGLITSPGHQEVLFVLICLFSFSFVI